MKNKLLSILAISILTSYSVTTLSSEGHDDHSKDEKHEEHADHDEHTEEKEHAKDDHGDEHAHKEKGEHGHEHEEEEESSSVGPDKGITEKSENGFKLSNEALKTMEIQMKPVGDSNLSIDKKTLVLVKDEKSVFRVRDGWIKRVPVQVLSKTSGLYTISSTSLKVGDQIIVHGTGYLRIAEVFATEGASHGHSH